MTDIVYYLRSIDEDQAADEIERLEQDAESLRNTITSIQLSTTEQRTEIERLKAVVDAARHLLAGGDKEAVYHLEKAIAALEGEK